MERSAILGYEFRHPLRGFRGMGCYARSRALPAMHPLRVNRV
jgi:hypothetical protein